MNARLLGLFSGFPSRLFPGDIAARLREELTCRESLVFVSAWPSEHDRNDADSAGMHGMFEACGLPFERFSVIDTRTTSENAQRLLREASCIFLMGGNATEQYRLICDKNIAEVIRESAAVVLGVSAGSSNMAVRALDIWESSIPYAGLGLTDITIKAHITPDDRDLLQKLQRITVEHGLPVCAMQDDSALFIKDDTVTQLGTIYWIENGEVSPFLPGEQYPAE